MEQALNNFPLVFLLKEYFTQDMLIDRNRTETGWHFYEKCLIHNHDLGGRGKNVFPGGNFFVLYQHLAALPKSSFPTLLVQNDLWHANSSPTKTNVSALNEAHSVDTSNWDYLRDRFHHSDIKHLLYRTQADDCRGKHDRKSRYHHCRMLKQTIDQPQGGRRTRRGSPLGIPSIRCSWSVHLVL